MNWWKSIILQEIKKILAYRFDFWVTFLGQSLIQVLISVSLWGTIFKAENKEVINGFSMSLMTLYYVIVPLGSKMLAGENVGFLSREIYDGHFSRYLVYPISFFRYKAFTYMTHSFFYGLQLFILFILYHIFQGQSLSPCQLLQLFGGISFFILASFTYFNLSLTIELLALWADHIWSLMVMMRFLILFLGGAYIPLTFFPDFLQKVLFFTPFPYFMNVPIKIIIGKASLQEMIIGLMTLMIWSLIFRGIAQIIWKRGEKLYTGVGI